MDQLYIEAIKDSQDCLAVFCYLTELYISCFTASDELTPDTVKASIFCRISPSSLMRKLTVIRRYVLLL